MSQVGRSRGTVELLQEIREELEGESMTHHEVKITVKFDHNPEMSKEEHDTLHWKAVGGKCKVVHPKIFVGDDTEDILEEGVTPTEHILKPGVKPGTYYYTITTVDSEVRDPRDNQPTIIVKPPPR